MVLYKRAGSVCLNDSCILTFYRCISFVIESYFLRFNLQSAKGLYLKTDREVRRSSLGLCDDTKLIAV